MAFFLLVLALGCSGGPVERTASKSFSNLRSLGDAYVTATMKTNRPPTKKEDLLPYLKHLTNPEEVFRSGADGEEFVILWGVDFRKVNEMAVIAYEKSSHRGERHVLQLRSNVSILTDGDFQKLPFPPGHKPPL